jgi:maltose phosphorylase
LELGLDFNVEHWNLPSRWVVSSIGDNYILGKTSSNQKVFSKYHFICNTKYKLKNLNKNLLNLSSISFTLKEDFVLEKRIVSLVDKKGLTKVEEFDGKAKELLAQASYQKTLSSNTDFYKRYWDNNDIEIKGDDYNQQGIRYCLFQLVNTYHGYSTTNNIGAKGLTGEAYSGHAFWDSEIFCLPVYLFSNPTAAKNLLMFRYNTLKEARLRAKELDCRGAAYPIATLNGTEACDLWQHASLQLQPTTGVAYAIWHYHKITKDDEFILDYGLEIMIEVARFLSSRGQYNQDKSKFGYYGVMGPDEFQMMVNHNAYTNLLGKKTMEYLLEIIDKYRDEERATAVIKRLGFTLDEMEQMKDQIAKMYIPYDPDTKIYEQHVGYHDLPHIDIHSIPVENFPLYSHWSYDRIYRNNLIKQPDVLMFMFLYNQEYDLETKKANYDYYEPRTIHESSLSPSIHSILATEIGYHQAALSFFNFATRMDIDDYNRNTREGLHMTSIAAAWMNIVYGFGGLRSDGDLLKLAPKCPEGWQSYQFKIQYHHTRITVTVFPNEVVFSCDSNLPYPIMIYDQKYKLEKGITKVNVGN